MIWGVRMGNPTVRNALTVATCSEEEFRFLSMGRSGVGRLLIVAYAEREGRTRIISAREATPRERRQYESTRSPKR
jgi:uncharacterized DUF497 family protein